MKKLAFCLCLMAATLYVAVMYEPVWLMNVFVIELVLVMSAAVTVLIFKQNMTFGTTALLSDRHRQL